MALFKTSPGNTMNISQVSAVKECPQCHKKYDDTWGLCLDCNVALTTQRTIQKDELSIDSLNALFEKDFKTPFLPGDGFYDNWNATDERLNLMAREILNWLNVGDHPLWVRYAKGMKVPGVYVWKEKEAGIFISDKFKQDPFQVGAILAHECMHHYMRIHQLELADEKKNEHKTDLATIYAGLGILIINGMSYKSHWYITVIAVFFGGIYINEQRRWLGYYKPQEYCEHFNRYLKLKSLDGGSVMGYIHPQARSFLPRQVSKKKPLTKSGIIESREKKHKSALVVQTLVAAVGVAFAITLFYVTGKERNEQTRQIVADFQSMKQQITDLENNIQQAQVKLEQMKKGMDYYETINDTANYGTALLAYEDLNQQVQKDYKRYRVLVNLYNIKLDGVKRGRR